MSKAIDTGDVVHHTPTGESWVVACVNGDRLSWCGWPEGTALLSDCTLVVKATPEERNNLLEQLADMQSPDHRKNHALALLVSITA
jgi:hypothetical protein